LPPSSITEEGEEEEEDKKEEEGEERGIEGAAGASPDVRGGGLPELSDEQQDREFQLSQHLGRWLTHAFFSQAATRRERKNILSRYFMATGVASLLIPTDALQPSVGTNFIPLLAMVVSAMKSMGATSSVLAILASHFDFCLTLVNAIFFCMLVFVSDHTRANIRFDRAMPKIFHCRLYVHHNLMETEDREACLFLDLFLKRLQVLVQNSALVTKGALHLFPLEDEDLLLWYSIYMSQEYKRTTDILLNQRAQRDGQVPTLANSEMLWVTCFRLVCQSSMKILLLKYRDAKTISPYMSKDHQFKGKFRDILELTDPQPLSYELYETECLVPTVDVKAQLLSLEREMDVIAQAIKDLIKTIGEEEEEEQAGRGRDAFWCIRPDLSEVNALYKTALSQLLLINSIKRTFEDKFAENKRSFSQSLERRIKERLTAREPSKEELRSPRPPHYLFPVFEFSS
jgi:hypothetical protein